MQQFNALLDEKKINNALIIPHVSPDGDTIGSAIAMVYLLMAKDVKGYIVINDDVPSNLSFLMDKMPKDIIRDLDSIDFKYDTVITVDCAEPKLFADRKVLVHEDIKLINIDHHFTNENYGDLNIVDIEASSTGELIYYIYETLGIKPNAFAAEALYAAIVTDTGNFRYSNTRAYTFEACSKLITSGFDFNTLNVELFQNKSFEKLSTLNAIFKTLSRHFDGRFAMVHLTNELKSALGFAEFDTDGVVEYIRDITGVEVVAFLKENSEGLIKGSMRSKYDFDVSAVAQYFGGGGHIKAAGFTTNKSLESVKAEMLTLIEKKI